MRRLHGLLVNLTALMILTLPCLAGVITSVSVPPTRNTGDTITATIWNNDVLGVYSYINNTLVPVLNVLNTKGDLYVYNGAALTRQPIGADTSVFTADSAQATGVKWSAFAGSTQLTTKGDMLGFSTVAVRVPVGANGTTPVADSTQAVGWRWGNPSGSVPSGAITAWSPAFAGTNAVPTGWLLCDGTNGTPNLIGRFIIGTRPTGSSATPAAGGFGAETADAVGTGALTHTHTFLASGNTGPPTGFTGVAVTGGTGIASGTHYHAFSVSGTSGSATVEPADYALVYIMKS